METTIYILGTIEQKCNMFNNFRTFE